MIVAKKNLLIETPKLYLDGKVLNVMWHQLIFLAYDSLRLFNLANTSLTESLLFRKEMCIAYRAWAYVIPACVPKLKVTYGILWGNLRCYMVLKLYHLHMLILKSLALPKVLMLSVVWVSAKPPITPHCLERLEFSLYMSALAQGFYLCSKRVFNAESPTKRLNIYFLARYMVGDCMLYTWCTNFKSLQFGHIPTWCFSKEREKC